MSLMRSLSKWFHEEIPPLLFRLPEWKWINEWNVCVFRFYRSDGEGPGDSSSEPLFSVNNSGTSRTRGSDRPGWEQDELHTFSCFSFVKIKSFILKITPCWNPTTELNNLERPLLYRSLIVVKNVTIDHVNSLYLRRVRTSPDAALCVSCWC